MLDCTVVTIRNASLSDAAALVAELGQASYFADRLERQRLGRGMLLVAWSGTRPVGAVYLWLDRAEERDIRRHLPGVPLLTHLEVASEFRNQGVGSNLIAEAERRILELGCDRIALAVEVRNWEAERLYKRLGFRDWTHGEVVCFDDNHRPEWCHVLVKTPVRAAGGDYSSADQDRTVPCPRDCRLGSTAPQRAAATGHGRSATPEGI